MMKGCFDITCDKAALRFISGGCDSMPQLLATDKLREQCIVLRGVLRSFVLAHMSSTLDHWTKRQPLPAAVVAAAPAADVVPGYGSSILKAQPKKTEEGEREA